MHKLQRWFEICNIITHILVLVYATIKLECKISSQEGFLESFSPQVKHPRTWRENRIIFVFVNRQTETVTITLEHNN